MYQGQPLGQVPTHLLQRSHLLDAYAAQEHHDRIGLGRDEPEQEQVPAAAVVAFENGLAEGALLVKRHLWRSGDREQNKSDRASGCGAGERTAGRRTWLYFPRTRWWMMCDPDVLPQELQNHLPRDRTWVCHWAQLMAACGVRLAGHGGRMDDAHHPPRT